MLELMSVPSKVRPFKKKGAWFIFAHWTAKAGADTNIAGDQDFPAWEGFTLDISHVQNVGSSV